MALTDTVITLAGLLEMVLPSATVRLCDGGFIDWPARGMFTSQDAVFGTVESVEAVGETIGDEAPGGKLTLLPPELVAAADLFQPTAQGSPIRFWLAEVNVSTGALVGTPAMQFDGLIDTMKVSTDRSTRRVEIEFIDAAERLFMIREGNVLSPRWHKAIWPGELGFDFATGAVLAVPWGVAGPPRGSTYTGSSGAGAGGGGYTGAHIL